MRKKLSAVILSALLSLTFLVGCSSGKSVLVFNNAFMGGGETGVVAKDPPEGYYETLSYKVFSSDKDYAYKKDSSIKDDVLRYEIAGTYTAALKVEKALPEEIAGAVNTDITLGGKVYKITTELKLAAKYYLSSKNAEDAPSYEHEDVISSEIYFLPFSESYAPIYAKSESDYTVVSFGKDAAALSAVKSFSEVKYYGGSYEIASRAVQYAVPTATSADVKNLEDEELKTARYDYAYKTVIDNAELLFAIRNVKVDVDSTFNLPTVSPAYGEATDLAVKNLQEYDDDSNFKYNTADFSGKIKVKELAYYVNSQNNTGSRQLVYVQKSEVKNGEETVIPDRALPVKMVSPLSAYGSFSRLGSLVYVLESVENGNAA